MRPRPELRRGIIILPSAFTLANLFFGVWAMVAAVAGDLVWAGWFIIFAGILDMLDGQIARFTRTGSRFGAELDSLVDAISFGVAPGLILYVQFYAEAPWGWIVSFGYIAAAVIRLARFNVEQSGGAHRHFLGLPSTTAGMMLASFHPFSTTPFFQSQLVDLPWPTIMGAVMVLLSALMLSHVPYARVPRISFRTARGAFWSMAMFAGMVAAIAVPRYYFFPALVTYILWGLIRAFLLGLQEEESPDDPLAADGTAEEDRPMEYDHLTPGRPRNRLMGLRRRHPEDRT